MYKKYTISNIMYNQHVLFIKYKLEALVQLENTRKIIHTS